MSQVRAKQLEGVHADQLLDNLITAIIDPTVNEDVALGYKPSSVWVNTILDKVFVCSDNSIGAAKWIEIKESSGASLTVTQALHGYSLCEVLKFNGTSYVRAQSDIQANVGIWLITKVIDANTFVISTNGYFTGLTGGTADTTGYLSSTTPGGLVTTAPAISQPIIYWTSATTGWILGYPSSQASVAPSSTPLGYNDLRTSFIGSNWAYEGVTNNGGGISLTGSIAVSGVAGWRYLVVSTAGVVAVEVIPVSEIISDISQYTPTPVFDVINNAYMSSVNPTKRIIAIAYFDATNIIETISYGHGSKKNDDYFASIGLGILSSAINDRFQYTNSFSKTRGTNISVVDNGVGTTDNEGFRITFNKNGKCKIRLQFELSNAAGYTEASVNKNSMSYITRAAFISAVNFYASVIFSIEDTVMGGDYFTFYLSSFSGTPNAYLNNPVIEFEEF